MAIIDTSKVTIPKGFFEDLNVPKLLEWLNEQPTADVVPREIIIELTAKLHSMLPHMKHPIPIDAICESNTYELGKEHTIYDILKCLDELEEKYTKGGEQK